MGLVPGKPVRSVERGDPLTQRALLPFQPLRFGFAGTELNQELPDQGRNGRIPLRGPQTRAPIDLVE